MSEPFRWYDKTTDRYVVAADDYDALAAARPSDETGAWERLPRLRLSGKRLSELAVSFGNVTNADAFFVDYDEAAEFVEVEALRAALANQPEPTRGAEDALRRAYHAWRSGRTGCVHDSRRDECAAFAESYMVTFAATPTPEGTEGP